MRGGVRAGAGRPQISQKVSIRLDNDVFELLQKESEKTGEKKREIIQKCIRIVLGDDNKKEAE